MQATLLVSREEAQQLIEILPGQPVTGAFLQQHGPVVMASAVESLEALLPRYEVVSVRPAPQDNPALVRLVIDYRLRTTCCEVCGAITTRLPERLHLTLGPALVHAWCSDACMWQLVHQSLAETEARRDALGYLVEAGMRSLRLRQAVPDTIRNDMTGEEWNALLKRCDHEYTAARRVLVQVLREKVGPRPVTQPKAPRRPPLLAAIAATQETLW